VGYNIIGKRQKEKYKHVNIKHIIWHLLKQIGRACGQTFIITASKRHKATPQFNEQ
jgi:hypothetical protein